MVILNVGQKARQTISSYTETVPVHMNSVSLMDLDVASCVIGDAKFAYDNGMIDNMEVSARKHNIENFCDLFGISDSKRVKMYPDELYLEKNEYDVVIESFDRENEFYKLKFPFHQKREQFKKSDLNKRFSCNCPRSYDDTGANLIVDKHMKFVGNWIVDVFGVVDYGIFGPNSPGYEKVGEVINYIGKNREKYEKLSPTKRTHKLINDKFLLKRIKLHESVTEFRNRDKS